MNQMEQNQQKKEREQQKRKERLLDMESLLLLLDSDPCLQEYHFRVLRMLHDILKELLEEP